MKTKITPSPTHNTHSQNRFMGFVVNTSDDDDDDDHDDDA
jgi:hypothetical protein